MKKSLLIFATAAILFSCGSTSTTSKTTPKNKEANPVKYAATITAEDLKKHLYIYASDAYEGRETGEPGQQKANDYLKKNYINMGVGSPLDSYFQPVALEKSKAGSGTITVNGTEFTLGEDFVFFSSAETTKANFKDLVFAGYGIDDEKHSDYKSLDVKGKFVLIKNGEPKNDDGTYVISGTKTASDWSSRLQSAFSSKTKAAKDNGAKGILFYIGDDYSMVKGYYKGMSQRSSMRLAEGSESFFNFIVNEALAKALLKNIETLTTTQNIKANLGVHYKNNSEKISSDNVLAHIKGSEKPDEYIVISAHLDHEGVKNGEVYNGADDDGSGTVAILEIAQAFKKAQQEGNGPKRSILFLHVTAEEKGLLGSRHYTDNDPVIPLANTVADLNIDMIGRTDPKRKQGKRNYIYLIGADKLSTELHTISEEMNTKYCNIELDYTFNDDNDPNRFYYRSDHYNFAKHNVPVIFYFNGTHDDYHKPSDTVEKIEFDLLENRTRLIFHTAWELANRDARIVVDKAEPKE